jgi:hypothetical protein
MTLYFYDEEAGVLVAFDRDAETVRALPLIGEVEFESEEEVEEVEEAAPADAVAKPAKGKGTRKCGLCGKTGHTRPTCPTGGRPAQEGNDEWNKLGDATGPRKAALSRMAFGRVKISQSHDITADTIARNLDEAVEEIEKALEAKTYDEYQKL